MNSVAHTSCTLRKLLTKNYGTSSLAIVAEWRGGMDWYMRYLHFREYMNTHDYVLLLMFPCVLTE